MDWEFTIGKYALSIRELMSNYFGKIKLKLFQAKYQKV
jgi:hypothetical protein